MTDRDHPIIHRTIKRLVKKKVRMNWNTVIEHEEYVEEKWPMIMGCFCALCTGKSHEYSFDAWTDHQIFCCATWGE